MTCLLFLKPRRPDIGRCPKAACWFTMCCIIEFQFQVLVSKLALNFEMVHCTFPSIYTVRGSRISSIPCYSPNSPHPLRTGPLLSYPPRGESHRLCYLAPTLPAHTQLYWGKTGAPRGVGWRPPPQLLGFDLKSLKQCWSESRLPQTANRGDGMTLGTPLSWGWPLIQQSFWEEDSFPVIPFSCAMEESGDMGEVIRTSF